MTLHHRVINYSLRKLNLIIKYLIIKYKVINNNFYNYMQVKIDTKNNLKTDQVRRIPMLVVPSITIVHITDVETSNVHENFKFIISTGRSHRSQVTPVFQVITAGL